MPAVADGGEEIGIEAGDFVVVASDAWRQITAETELRVLAIGAPNIKDDGITAEGEE